MGTTLQSELAGQSVNDRTGGGLPLVSSVLGALAYADLFDAPLSLEELHRYQVATSYTATEIAGALSSEPALVAHVATDGKYYCLRGREVLFSLRAKRAVASARVWVRARRYARWLARLPFVRMVAVTGALAVDNLNGRDDIDLLVISRAGRVWLCRRGLIALVRLGRIIGDDLCPNYILSEGSLALAQRDFFTAHELAQMVPVYGGDMYVQMLNANVWACAFLPALAPVESAARSASERPHVRRSLERVLQSTAFDGWEHWEMERLRNKLRAQVGDDAEVVLTPDQCKGHTGLHRAAVMSRYKCRLAEMGLQAVIASLAEAEALAAQRPD